MVGKIIQWCRDAEVSRLRAMSFAAGALTGGLLAGSMP